MRPPRRQLNATGFARMLARGIRANFAPECQDAKIEEFAELFRDMAMSCEMDAECSHSTNDSQRAHHDAIWLDHIADELDSQTDASG